MLAVSNEVTIFSYTSCRHFDSNNLDVDIVTYLMPCNTHFKEKIQLYAADVAFVCQEGHTIIKMVRVALASYLCIAVHKYIVSRKIIK
jgi:hypothetical protein